MLDIRLEEAALRRKRRPREPSAETRLRVLWLEALVERFGSDRVGWPTFRPPQGWTFLEWRARVQGVEVEA